jgi:hypothetical protein
VYSGSGVSKRKVVFTPRIIRDVGMAGILAGRIIPRNALRFFRATGCRDRCRRCLTQELLNEEAPTNV